MPFYICSKLFHHAHNFEYTLQWAVHNPNINWLCEAVTLERKLKAKILSISSKAIDNSVIIKKNPNTNKFCGN